MKTEKNYSKMFLEAYLNMNGNVTITHKNLMIEKYNNEEYEQLIDDLQKTRHTSKHQLDFKLALVNMFETFMDLERPTIQSGEPCLDEEFLTEKNSFEKEMNKLLKVDVIDQKTIDDNEDLKHWMLPNTRVVIEDGEIVKFEMDEHYKEMYPELVADSDGYVSIDLVIKKQ